MPYVGLPPTGHDSIPEVYPGFPDQLRLLVVVENRDFQLVVVWRVVHVEPKLLIPVYIHG